MLHRGATSQDVVDTAAMLVAKRALEPLLADLDAAGDAAAALADRHRGDLAAGRTLLQQALPITFGLRAAGWLGGLDDAAARLAAVRDERLAIQFGGAVGTLASLGTEGPAVAEALARQLDLPAPPTPWQTNRARVVELAAALGEAAGAAGKVGTDVVLLAQTEVGEVAEGGEGGGSSTLPQKRNPTNAVAAIAAARRTPGLVATLFAAMPGEQERAAGAWQAEAETLSELLRLTGVAVAAVRSSLEGIEVFPDRMRANLDLTDGLVMSESLASALGETLGRARAQELVGEAAKRVLAERPLARRRRRGDPRDRRRARRRRHRRRPRPGRLSRRHRRADRPRPRRPPRAAGRRPVTVPLHHQVEGPADAPALVLLNSLGTDLRMWDAQAAALRGEFRIVRCDARGHGDSPYTAAPWTLADLGADVLRLLDLLAIEEAHVAGVSLGGATAVWLAAHAPERVDRLVACFTSAFFGPPDPWLARAETVRAEGVAAVSEAVARALVHRRDRPRPARSDEGDARGDAARRLRRGDRGRRPPRPARRPRRRSPRRRSSSPAPRTPPRRPRWAARSPTASPAPSFVEIPGAAHLGNVERPDPVTDLIRSHLPRRRDDPRPRC